jgi:prepilin-type processing-associated H-X9-DG protein
MSCQNNLKQIGLALLNYHEAHKKFPPSQTAAAPNHNWPAFTLPYLEQDNLQRLYDFSVNWNHANNRTAVRTTVKTFICPSSPEDPQRRADASTNANAPAVSDYAALNNVAPVLINFRPELVAQTPAPWNKALMTKGNGVRMAEVLDGTSMTILITEDGGRPAHYLRGGMPGPRATTVGCGNADVANGIVSGAGWAVPASDIPLHGFQPNGLTCVGPCAINCTNNNEAYAFHVGGLNAVFGDGSVRFLSQDTNIRIFAALVTMRGREVVSSNDF